MSGTVNHMAGESIGPSEEPTTIVLLNRHYGKLPSKYLHLSF